MEERNSTGSGSIVRSLAERFEPRPPEDDDVDDDVGATFANDPRLLAKINRNNNNKKKLVVNKKKKLVVNNNDDKKLVINEAPRRATPTTTTTATTIKTTITTTAASSPVLNRKPSALNPRTTVSAAWSPASSSKGSSASSTPTATPRQRLFTKDDNETGDAAAKTKRAPPPLLRGVSGSADIVFNALAQLYNINDFDATHIGSGFYGDVYKVVHLETEEVMVLKKNKFKGNAKFVLNEIELLHKLSHENILRHLGACVEGGTLHPLTEFIDGGDLEKLLQGPEPLSWQTRVHLCADIASGMSYLHSQNFLHRDLTSKNCLIRRPRGSRRRSRRRGGSERRGPGREPRQPGGGGVLGHARHPSAGDVVDDDAVDDDDADDDRLQAVICDYGLATKIPDPKCQVVKRLSIKGHPFWMSPECMTGKDYDQSSDVFSFGIILCEVLTRRDADPDVLTRTRDFGLDGDNLRRLIRGLEIPPPEALVNLAIVCCSLDPSSRPSFKELHLTLKDIVRECRH